MAETIGDARAHAHALGQLGCLIMLFDPGTGDPMLRQAVDLGRAGRGRHRA